jgi:hypothetical protein
MKNEILKILNSQDPINQQELTNIYYFIHQKPEVLEDLILLLYQENTRVVQKTGLILSE